MKLKNYTPHLIRVFKQDGSYKEYQSEGIARVEEEVEDLNIKQGIQFCKVDMGKVTGLPPTPEKNTLYIVSSIVQMASDRKDLVTPTDYIRNQQGIIVGCRKLKVNY